MLKLSIIRRMPVCRGFLQPTLLSPVPRFLLCLGNIWCSDYTNNNDSNINTVDMQSWQQQRFKLDTYAQWSAENFSGTMGSHLKKGDLYRARASFANTCAGSKYLHIVYLFVVGNGKNDEKLHIHLTFSFYSWSFSLKV